MLNGLDLFSGYGGISEGLRDFVRPILYCDKEDFAKGILLSRMDEQLIPFAPIWDDVTTLDGRKFKGLVDIIYGGFPCQDISTAGNGAGLDGKRSGLFKEIIRLAKEAKPAFIFLENVPAIEGRGAEKVQEALASNGFLSRWTHLSAAEVGANHKRERWFCLAFNAANANRLGLRDKWERSAEGQAKTNDVFGNDGQKRHVAFKHGHKNHRYSSECRHCEPWTNVANARSTRLQGSEWTGADSGENIQREARSHGSTTKCSDDGGIREEQRDVAHSYRLREQPEQDQREGKSFSGTHDSGSNEDLSNSNMQRHGRQAASASEEDHERIRQSNGRPVPTAFNSSWWEVEPNVGRVVNGPSFRMDSFKSEGGELVHKSTNQTATIEEVETSFRQERIKALGNGVVPLQVKTAWELLLGVHYGGNL